MEISLDAFLGMVGNLDYMLDMARKDPFYLQGNVYHRDICVNKRDELKALYCELEDAFEMLPASFRTRPLARRMLFYGISVENVLEASEQVENSNGQLQIN